MSDIKLPFYQPMMSPSAVGQYRGPTAEQVAALQAKKTQGAMGAITGAMDAVTRIIEQQQKIQAAYDSAQLAKAKATYFKTMREKVESYQFSELNPLEYQDAYEKDSQKAAFEAQKVLDESKGRMLLGSNRNRENLTTLDFEAWKMEQDANMQSFVLQSQRKKMTEQATVAIQNDLDTVRRDYAYLQTFEENRNREVQDGTISGDFAARMIESARRIVKIGTYSQQAQDMYALSEEGKRQATLWVNNPANFKEMSSEEHDRFVADFNRWTQSITAVHERGKEEMVIKAYDEYTTKVHTPGADIFSVRKQILQDPRWMDDHLAPVNSRQGLDYKNRFLNMIDSMIASAATGKDLSKVSDPDILRRAQEMVHDPNVDEATMTKFLYANHGPMNGKPTIGFTEWDELMRLTRDKKKSQAFSDGAGLLWANTGAGKLLTYAETEGLIRSVHQEIYSRMYTKGAKPMSEEEVAAAFSNKFLEAQRRQSSKPLQGFGDRTPKQDEKRMKGIEGIVAKLVGANPRVTDKRLKAYLEYQENQGMVDWAADDPLGKLEEVVSSVEKAMVQKAKTWSGEAPHEVVRHQDGMVAVVYRQKLARGATRDAAFTLVNRDGKLMWAWVTPSATTNEWRVATIPGNLNYTQAVEQYDQFRTKVENQPGSSTWTPPKR